MFYGSGAFFFLSFFLMSFSFFFFSFYSYSGDFGGTGGKRFAAGTGGGAGTGALLTGGSTIGKAYSFGLSAFSFSFSF
jgi:hypothetical protein